MPVYNPIPTPVPLKLGGTAADLSATGGTSRVLKQITTGAAITVAQLAAADLSNGVTGSGAVVLANNSTINCTAINLVACISPGNPQGWAGIDIIDWLTAAIAYVETNTNGGRIEIANGTYLTNGAGATTIAISKPVEIVGSGWGTNIQLASGVGATPLLRFAPSGIVRGFSIRNIQFSTQSGTPGTYALELVTSPNNPFRTFLIDHIFIDSGFGTDAIWLNNTAGESDGGFYDGTISNSFIFGGILGTLVGDSLNIDKNLITDVNGGAKQSIGVDVSFTPGSSSFRLTNGTINTQGAALHIGSAATYVQVSGMEFETPINTTAGSNGAYVDVDGTVGNPANVIDFHKNSFQIVNSSPLNGLRLNYVAHANVRDNNFTRGVGAVDIAITANATQTRIRPNNFDGGDTVAHAFSDASAVGQTMYEFGGQGTTAIPLIFRDNTGATEIYGAGSQQFGAGAPGATQLFDGIGNNIALVATNSASSVPVSGTVVSVDVLSAKTGYRINGAATSTHVLRGDGTNFVDAALAAADLSNGVTGSGAVVLASGPILTNATINVTGNSTEFKGAGNTQVSFGLEQVGIILWTVGTTANSADWKFSENTDLSSPVLTITGGGIKVNGGATSTHVLRGNGTNFVDAALSTTDLNGVGGTVASRGPVTVISSITTVNGIVTALTGTSDERLKNSKPYVTGLDAVLAINPIQFTWNEKGQAHAGLPTDQEFIGFSAQDVQKAIPLAITGTEGQENYLSLDTRPIIAALVNAVKELTARVKELEAKKL